MLTVQGTEDEHRMAIDQQCVRGHDALFSRKILNKQTLVSQLLTTVLLQGQKSVQSKNHNM